MGIAGNRRAGRYSRYVTLSRSPQHTDDSDGFFEPLSPPNAWCAISPIGSDGVSRAITHNVEMPYHAQVSLDTRIVYNRRELFVRSVQNVDETNTILRLVCEEIS